MRAKIIFFWVLGGMVISLPFAGGARESQQTKLETNVSGAITDVLGNPVSYATVALLRGGEYIGGCTADSAGVFRLGVFR